MSSAPYRIAGAFVLRIGARRPHLLHRTPIAIDVDAFARWITALCADAGLTPHVIVATDEGLAMIAVARDPGAVPALAAWVPSLRARPLHTVNDYYSTLAQLAQHPNAG